MINNQLTLCGAASGAVYMPEPQMMQTLFCTSASGTSPGQYEEPLGSLVLDATVSSLTAIGTGLAMVHEPTVQFKGLCLILVSEVIKCVRDHWRLIHRKMKK